MQGSEPGVAGPAAGYLSRRWCARYDYDTRTNATEVSGSSAPCTLAGSNGLVIFEHPVRAVQGDVLHSSLNSHQAAQEKSAGSSKAQARGRAADPGSCIHRFERLA